MRHRRGNSKLSKPTDQRIALLRSLSLSLFKNRSIMTTDKRAKQVERYANHIINYAKKGDTHSFGLALKLLPNKLSLIELFKWAKSITPRSGSHIKSIKCGFRKGDASPVTKLELI